ncbi:hypothetical protein ACFYU4_38390 [Streptomyces tendae]|uniref:hypothetical protein n=1 Tax=Streptomyces tendae TaxID=1932 RepID=UPI003687484C
MLGLQLNDRADAGQDGPPLHQLVAQVRRHTELLGQLDIAVPNDLKKVQLTHQLRNGRWVFGGDRSLGLREETFKASMHAWPGALVNIPYILP